MESDLNLGAAPTGRLLADNGGTSTSVIIALSVSLAVVVCCGCAGAIYVRWLYIRANRQDDRRSFLIRDLVRKRTSEFTHQFDSNSHSSDREAPKNSEEHFASVAGQLAHSKGNDLLFVPEMISFQGGQALRRLAQAMVADIACHNAPVFVINSVGHRELDATGFGPGSCYCAAVLKAFHDEGIQCFSCLSIPTGMNFEIFVAQLAGRFTTCKAVLVLQTIDLYESKPCLRDIYEAQKSVRIHGKIDIIIPVRFEVDLPPLDRQWPSIAPSDLDGTMMVTEVQNDFCQLESFPKYPKTMLSDPNMLDDLVSEVKKGLADPEYFVTWKEQLTARSRAPIPANVLGDALHRRTRGKAPKKKPKAVKATLTGEKGEDCISEAELQFLKLSQLQKRAIRLGADQIEIDEALDDDDPKEAIIALVLSKQGNSDEANMEQPTASDEAPDSTIDEAYVIGRRHS